MTAPTIHAPVSPAVFQVVEALAETAADGFDDLVESLRELAEAQWQVRNAGTAGEQALAEAVFEARCDMFAQDHPVLAKAVAQ